MQFPRNLLIQDRNPMVQEYGHSQHMHRRGNCLRNNSPNHRNRFRTKHKWRYRSCRCTLRYQHRKAMCHLLGCPRLRGIHRLAVRQLAQQLSHPEVPNQHHQCNQHVAAFHC